MEQICTCIYIVLIKDFFSVSGVEYANTTTGDDFILCASLDEACSVKDQRRDQCIKTGWRLTDFNHYNNGGSLLSRTRLEHIDESARVIEIHKKFVLGDLSQVVLS